MSRGRTLDKRQVEMAAQLVNEGQSMQATAREMGVHRVTLQRAFKREGIPYKYPVPYKKYTPGRARRVEQLIKEGMTIEAAAREAGVTTSILYLWQQKGLCDIRGNMSQGRRLGDDRYRRIYQRYINNPDETPQGLAKIYGVDYTTLMDNWQKLGLKVDQERTMRLRKDGTARAWKARGATEEQLRQAYNEYARPGSYVGSVQISRRMHMAWVTLKREWGKMGLDVTAAVRAKYDRERGAGAYDARMKRNAERASKERKEIFSDGEKENRGKGDQVRELGRG